MSCIALCNRNTHSNEDFFLWPDNSICMREDFTDMAFKSDDYEVILFDTPRWHQLAEEHGFAADSVPF